MKYKNVLSKIVFLLIGLALILNSCRQKRWANYHAKSPTYKSALSYDEAIALEDKSLVQDIILEYILVVPDLSMFPNLVRLEIKSTEDYPVESYTNLRTAKGVEILFIERDRDLKILPQELSEMDALTNLAISQCYALKDYSVLKDCVKLKLLNLGYNNLRECPKEIASLSSLEYLTFAGNYISTFQPLYGLKKLAHLGIGGDSLKTIPLVVEKLENLIELRLDPSHQLADYSRLSALSKVEELNLGQCNLSSIPHELSFMTNLKRLELYDNKTLTDFSGLLELKDLEYLSLSGVLKDKLPREIFEMNNLKTIDLSYCPLSEEEMASLKKALPSCNIYIYSD